MPNQLPHPDRRHRGLLGASRRGFTLIEMLVAIGIILVMVGISLPIMSTMQNWSKVDSGVNTVGVAAQAARSYFDREKTGNTDPFLNPTESRPAAPFEGIALVFAPSGEIRITRFNPGAVDGAGDLLVNLIPKLVGFEDIPNRDYIDIPDSVEIYGIRRDGTIAASLEFIRPPFAIRFDGHGHLITGRDDARGTEDSNLVFYDADFNGFYNTSTAARTGSAWESGGYNTYRGSYVSSEWDSDRQAHTFDFEGLETVVGVRVVDPLLYNAADPATADPDSYRDIFFSRYTGSPLRNQ